MGQPLWSQVSIRIRFFCCCLLEVDDGFGLAAWSPSNLGKVLSSSGNSFPAHSQTILYHSGVKIQVSPVDLTFLDLPWPCRILRSFPVACWAGFLESIWA